MSTICTLRLTKSGNFGVTVAEIDETGYRPLCSFIFPIAAVKGVVDGTSDKVTKAEFKPKNRK